MHAIDLIDVKRASHLVTTLTDTGARRSASRLNLQICHSGKILGTQGGVSVETEPGDALLIRSDLAGTTEFMPSTRMHGIFIDIERVRPLLKADLPDKVVLVRSESRPALKLLSAWLQALSRAEISLDSGLRSIVAAHVADLIVLTLDPRDDAREEAESRTGKVARLHAILDQIATRSHEPISAEGIGASLGISERYVRLLLQETGRTLSEHVLEQRLLSVFKLLRDPRLGARRISEIAFQAGFDDISYFNRTFRARFGDTPSAARTQAMRVRDSGS
ncbi:MAG: AraC family transcriptional regulator [Pseudomonadota bacterium]